METGNAAAGDDPGLANGGFLCFVCFSRRVGERFGCDYDSRCDDVAGGSVVCGSAIGKDAPYVTLVVGVKGSDWGCEGVGDVAGVTENESTTGNGNAFLPRNEVAYLELDWVGF